MTIFTVFCQEAAGSGTTWIDSIEAATKEEAADTAVVRCANDWEYSPADVRVLGIAEGDIKILYWEDAY